MRNPDTIYYNGQFHSMDEHDQEYEALAVTEGKISALGTTEEMLALQGDQTELINLEGKTAVPGFIDGHQHMFHLGYNLLYVDCRLDSVKAVVEAITERAQQTKSDSEWVIGWGFDESLYKEGRRLNKEDFAQIKNPVYITRYCHHEGVANQVALDLAGITKETTIENGIIHYDELGEPTGLLVEQGMSLIQAVLPPYTHESMTEAIGLANAHFLKNGITTVHEAGLGFLYEPYKEFAVLQEMSAAGSLTIRMNLMVMADYYKEFIEKHLQDESDQLKLGALKIFADGTLSGRTAAVLEPYLDSDDRGMLLWEDEELLQYVQLAHEMDRQVAIHAIGDRAIDQVLRMYETVNEKYPRKDHRHRVEHTTLSNKNILQRMQDLGSIPVPQPMLLHTAGDVYIQNVTKDRWDNLVALRDFIDYDLHPVGSSDSPIIDCSPMDGIFAAMSRRTIQGTVIGTPVTLAEAVKMYTYNCAYAVFEEEIKGTLEVGKFADLAILPADFMNFTADQVRETQIEKTVVGGKIVYENN